MTDIEIFDKCYANAVLSESNGIPATQHRRLDGDVGAHAADDKHANYYGECIFTLIQKLPYRRSFGDGIGFSVMVRVGS